MNVINRSKKICEWLIRSKKEENQSYFLFMDNLHIKMNLRDIHIFYDFILLCMDVCMSACMSVCIYVCLYVCTSYVYIFKESYGYLISWREFEKKNSFPVSMILLKGLISSSATQVQLWAEEPDCTALQEDASVSCLIYLWLNHILTRTIWSPSPHVRGRKVELHSHREINSWAHHHFDSWAHGSAFILNE